MIMARKYDNSNQKFFRDPKRLIVKKYDGLLTAAERTSPSQVEDSLDEEFGSKNPRLPYRPHPIPTIVLLLVLLLASQRGRAENAQLNSAIQGDSSQTVLLQGAVSTLGADENALIQRYHLTNANQCNLLVVAVSTASIPINFVASTSPITDVQADLLFSSSFTITSSVIGPAGTAAGKSVQVSAIPGGERVIVFGLNQTPIGSGLLATLTYSAVANTPKGVYPISIANLAASDAGGNSKLLCGVSGAIKL